MIINRLSKKLKFNLTSLDELKKKNNFKLYI
jgi:hypothetical protein